MVTKSVAVSMLVLRVVALAASAATVALVDTDNVKFSVFSEKKFHDVISYRYVLAVAVIAGAYAIVQLPFAIYYCAQPKKLMRDGFLPDFDFYGDKITSVLLGTGVGAGFAVSLDSKKFFDDILDAPVAPMDDLIRSKIDKFLIRGIIASAVLAVAMISMVVVSVISSINRSRSKGMFG